MSNPKKILFWPDVYKEQGHWLPTLAWADCLDSMKDSNDEKLFDIEYMGIADCEELILSYNKKNGTDFKYSNIFYVPEETKESIYPPGYTNECRTTPGNRWKTDHVWALAYAGFDNKDNIVKAGAPKNSVIYRNAVEFRERWKKIKPNLMVSGYFTALETLIIYYHHKFKSDVFTSKTKFAISTTYLRHPSENPASRALQNLMAFTPDEQRKLINMVAKDKSDPDEYMEDYGITPEQFVEPLRSFPEYIPCPKKFDYAHYAHGNLVSYGEPCITKELEGIEDDSSEIQWEEILGKDKIIYVTAGSQVLDYTESALSLFMAMISAMQSSDMKDYHLILCVGSTLIQNHWDEYDNVTVCGWAPQRQILQAISEKEDKNGCAIIHGGLATIKECIYYEVPFLVLPLGKDQMDNALRLEDCGIRNRFHIEYIKPKCLRYFINQVLQDYTSLQNLKKLSRIFRNEEAKHPTAKKIARYALEK